MKDSSVLHLTTNTMLNNASIPANDAALTLFVGDLSFFCDDEKLFHLFAPFGSLKTAQIRRGRRGDSLLYGFVEFMDKESANRAIEEIDLTNFMGRRIRVKWADKNAESPPQQFRHIQVHVSFVGGISCSKVTEEVLQSIFCKYGEVTDCVVRRYVLDNENDTQNGYGFVYFATHESAATAVAAVQKSIINGVTFDCDISHRTEGQPFGTINSSTKSNTNFSASQQVSNNKQSQYKINHGATFMKSETAPIPQITVPKLPIASYLSSPTMQGSPRRLASNETLLNFPQRQMSQSVSFTESMYSAATVLSSSSTLPSPSYATFTQGMGHNHPITYQQSHHTSAAGPCIPSNAQMAGSPESNVGVPSYAVQYLGSNHPQISRSSPTMISFLANNNAGPSPPTFPHQPQVSSNTTPSEIVFAASSPSNQYYGPTSNQPSGVYVAQSMIPNSQYQVVPSLAVPQTFYTMSPREGINPPSPHNNQVYSMYPVYAQTNTNATSVHQLQLPHGYYVPAPMPSVMAQPNMIMHPTSHQQVLSHQQHQQFSYGIAPTSIADSKGTRGFPTVVQVAADLPQHQQKQQQQQQQQSPPFPPSSNTHYQGNVAPQYSSSGPALNYVNTLHPSFASSATAATAAAGASTSASAVSPPMYQATHVHHSSASPSQYRPHQQQKQEPQQQPYQQQHRQQQQHFSSR